MIITTTMMMAMIMHGSICFMLMIMITIVIEIMTWLWHDMANVMYHAYL